MEGNMEVPNGWPLGLGNINSRVIVNTSQLAAPPQANTSGFRRSSSFSSFSSSSNLDTESTASFLPDQSVSLGRLIGIQPANKGSLYCEQDRNNIVADERSRREGVPSDEDHRQDEDGSQGHCVPLLHHVIGRMGRSRSTSIR